jgi:hypothetical protein
MMAWRRRQVLAALGYVIGFGEFVAFAQPTLPERVRATEAMQELLKEPAGETLQLYYYRLVSWAKKPKRHDDLDRLLDPEPPAKNDPKIPVPTPAPPPVPTTPRFQHIRTNGILPSGHGYYEYIEKWRITDHKLIEAWRHALTSPKIISNQKCQKTTDGFRCPGNPECFMPGLALEFRSRLRTVFVLICSSCGFFLVTTPGSRMLLMELDEDSLVCALRKRSEDSSCEDN